MNDSAVLEFWRVSKSFSRHKPRELLRHRLIDWVARRNLTRFYALKDISFSLKRGESLAVIGPNGAGKSTLLGLIAGVSSPDSGSIFVKGRVAALLELGSGFHPDLTGTENIKMNAALLGFSREDCKRLLPEIVDFSELAEFLDEPLRTYSTGMVMRLAFSVAVNLNPDILITDEILAVGDHSFQQKCFERMREFRKAGKTLLFVSHAPGMLDKMCDRALWLDHGQMIMDSSLANVLPAYMGRATAASS